MKRKIGKRVSGEPVVLEAHKIIQINQLPRCDMCDNQAEYDFKTRMGPWAYGCEQHWHTHRAYEQLGTGMGQLLVATGTVEEVVTAS